MFGRATIKTLRGQVEELKRENGERWKGNLELSNELDQVLTAHQQTQASLDAQLEIVASLESMNTALHEENSGLVFQLEMYRAVLKQLRINVTLPAKK